MYKSVFKEANGEDVISQFISQFGQGKFEVWMEDEDSKSSSTVYNSKLANLDSFMKGNHSSLNFVSANGKVRVLLDGNKYKAVVKGKQLSIQSKNIFFGIIAI